MRLRGSMKSKIAILTVLVFMLSMVFSFSLTAPTVVAVEDEAIIASDVSELELILEGDKEDSDESEAPGDSIGDGVQPDPIEEEDQGLNDSKPDDETNIEEDSDESEVPGDSIGDGVQPDPIEDEELTDGSDDRVIPENEEEETILPLKMMQSSSVSPPVSKHLVVKSSTNLFRRPDGTVYSWGFNNVGQLGIGTTQEAGREVPIPMQIEELSGIQRVVAGKNHAAAIQDDGTCWLWGYDRYGEFGDGNKKQLRYRPEGFTAVSNVRDFALGYNHTLVLTKDGKVWAYGYNDKGQLGDGSKIKRLTPVQVVGPDGEGYLENIVAVAASEYHSAALKSDGTVWTWGGNTYGQLGNGEGGNYTFVSLIPVQVKGPDGVGVLDGIIDIAAGHRNTIALKNDGTVWTWGDNGNGQLGNGTTVQSLVPVQVLEIDDVCAISISEFHCLALKTDGTVWGWGKNSEGQLGNGSRDNRETKPIKAQEINDVIEIATGTYHSAALSEDGNVYTWGRNMSGVLGNGDPSNILYVELPTKSLMSMYDLLTPPGIMSSSINPGQPAELTFEADEDWINSINAITVGGIELTADQYQKEKTKVIISADVFTAEGEYSIVIGADGYFDAKTTQEVVLKNPPALSSATPDSRQGQEIVLSFEDESAWREVIKGILVNDEPVDSEKYDITAGRIAIDGSIFSESGLYTIKVLASVYYEANIEQYVSGTWEDIPIWSEEASLTAENIMATELVLRWPEVSNPEDLAGYKVYVDGEEEATLPATQKHYELFGLNSGQKYTLSVKPFNESGLLGNTIETVVVTSGAGGLTFSFSPYASDEGGTEFYHNYKIIYPVDLDNLVLSWNFSNGLDRNLRFNLECIRLIEKDTGQQISLDLGTPSADGSYAGNEDGVFAAGDFTYISSGSGDDASKVRMLKFAPQEATLEQMSKKTEYIVEIGPEFTANNERDTLGKIFTFSFITAGDDTEAPAWPDNAEITVSKIGPTSVVLSWPEARDNVAVSNYEVSQASSLIKTVSGQNTSYKVENLMPNTDYEFTVIAKDAKGNTSEGLKKTVKTLLTDNESPTWPTGSKIVADNILPDNLDLSWTEAQDNLAVTGYRLFKNGEVIAEVDAATRSYHVIGLTPATNYMFKVEARDEYGNYSKDGPQVVIRTLAGEVDTEPPYWTDNGSWTTSTKYLGRETRATLIWPWAADNVAVWGYEIYRGDDLIATVDAYNNSYIDILVPDGKTYDYTVYALDAAGNKSTIAQRYSIRAGDPDPDLKSPYWPAGTSITLSEFTDDTLKVHWSEALDNVAVVHYIVIKDGLWVEYANADEEETTHRSFENRFTIYDPQYNTTGIEKNYPALTSGETYTFSIKAVDPSGNGSKGDPWITFVMGTNPTAGSEIPFALVNLYNTRGSLNSLTGALNRVTMPQDPRAVKFIWEFEEPLAEGYADNITVHKADDQEAISLTSENFAYGNTDGKGILTLDFSGIQLANEGTYIVRLGKELAAQSGKQIGLDIAWQFNTALDDKTPPEWGDGAELKAEAIITPSVVTLTWPEATDNVAVTQYKVYKGEELLATLPAEARSYNAEGLDLGKEYQFKVVAGDYLNNFSDSLETNVTTPGEDNKAPDWTNGTEVSFSDICSDNVIVTWSQANDNYQVTAYKLYKNDEAEPFATVDGTNTTHKITGLQGETKYTIKIVALDAVGNVSPEILGEVTTADDTIQPIWPENSQLQAKDIKDTAVTLYWTAATDNVGVAKYNIYQDDEFIADVTGDVEYKVTGLTGSTEYKFEVEAVDAAGNITAGKLSISQWTAPNTITSGAKFDFWMAAPTSHNLSLDTENNILHNEVDGSFIGDNVAFTFTFAEGLQSDTWLENIILTQKDGTEVTLGENAFEYTEKTGEKDARLKITVPAELIDSEGGKHKLTLKNDLTAIVGEERVTLGRTFTWDFNVYVGECGLIDIAAGFNSDDRDVIPAERFYLVLMEDGSVWSWGNNDYGTLGDSTTDYRENLVRVDALSDIVALEAGRSSCFALDRDGNVWAWGSNEYGQLGKGTEPGGTSGRYGNNTPQKITVPADLPAIKKLSFGFGHVVAIDINGEVWNWGAGVKDGYASEAQRSGTPLKVNGLSNVVDVAAGYYTSLAVTTEGDVYSFSRKDKPLVKVEGLSQIVAVDAQGINQFNTISMALKADGTVYIWDKDEFQPDIPQPEVVANATQIKAICADGPYVLGSDGQVRTVIFDPVNSSRLGTEIHDLKNISKLASSAQGGLALLNDGSLLQFGNETTRVNLTMDPAEAPVWPEGSAITVSNLTEAGLTLNWNKPHEDVSGFTIYQNGGKIASVSGNRLSYDVVGLTKGQTYTFEVEARFAQSPWSTTGPTLEQTMLSNWNPVVQGAGKMAAGGRHTLLIDSDGNVWAWGQNDYGQLGIGNKEQQLEPVKVTGLSNVVAVAAGDNHSLALDEDGKVYAWGRNNLYQLGNDTTVDSLIPVNVFSGVKAISAAANYSLALKTDGTVYGWGEPGEVNCGYSLTNNGKGHDGRTPVQMCYNTNVPSDIHPFKDVKGIAAAPRFAVYLFNDGRICRQGYFMDEVGAPTYSPMQHYSALMGVQGIAAGDEFVAALLEDGTVATLGNNIQGQFGNGGQSNATPASPVPYAKVKNLTDVVGIAAGGAHGVALDSDGNVWTWGKNQYGQLGNGSNIVSLVPIQVQGLSGITAVAGGRDNTLAMQNDQKVYAWGDNSGGQLGSGDKLSSKMPVLVRMVGYNKAVNAPVWPASFTIVKKAQTADSITLMWTPAKSSISIAGYEVYQDGNKVGEVSGNTYEYTVKELQKDKDYTFGIKAKDSAENASDLSNTISLTFTGEEEGGIDNLAPEWDAGAVITTDGKTPYTITISWLAAKDNVAVTGYRIFANGKNAGSTSKTSYTIGDLSPDREYLITVEALDAAYNVSEPLFTTIKTPDTMPFLWMAEVTNKGDISLTFSKAMADPVGTHEQFTAKIDGADAQIKGVESTNTVEKIKLVLENKIDSYEKIVITYTKSEEPDKQIKSTDGAAVESFIAHIGKSAPSLTADTTNNALGQAIEITFTPDADWVKAITDVTVDGISTEGKYTISEGKIVLNPEVFSLPGQYHIIVKAEGYSDAGVIQVISSDQDTVGRLVIFQKPFASYAGPTGGVGIDGEFKVGFMEQIVPESLKIILNKIGTTGNLESKKESVAFTYELNQNKVLNIKTKEKLDYGTYYELVLPAGIEDVKGNISEDDSKVVFYTASFKPPVYKVTQDGKEVSGVVAGQSYQLTATLENSSDQSQTVDAILQLRGGKGARENQGGDVLDQLNQRITVDSRQTTDVTLEFTVPVDIDSSVIYGDIFIWEKDGVYASAEPVHFSCPVN